VRQREPGSRIPHGADSLHPPTAVLYAQARMTVSSTPLAPDPTVTRPSVTAARDRVDDWLYELQRVVLGADALSTHARDLVVAVIDACESEDGVLPRFAADARACLAAGAHTDPGAVMRARRGGALLGALASRLHAQRSAPGLPEVA
jgi:hypothetical protein